MKGTAAGRKAEVAFKGARFTEILHYLTDKNRETYIHLILYEGSFGLSVNFHSTKYFNTMLKSVKEGYSPLPAVVIVFAILIIN